MIEPWFVFLPFAVFFVWLLFGTGSAASCPACKTPLPRFQSPLTKTRRMWLEGGHVCPCCRCETDAAGNPASLSATPPWRVIRHTGLLLLLVAIPASVLLTLLLMP